ncbi:hypothetical protein [uncultured Secundilactobacillus sp.]|uniref:hypothetical protein n=1 Tax=uncultured Secundilactobacillus sp. TaxID=2813935 RepID=UPI00258D6480|nr:hypothetical protein [uncultured Secundilactobacillus sp.]
MKISDQELKERAVEGELTLTQDPAEAIFLLRDGTGISGEMEMGVRGLDHNSVTSLVEPEIKSGDPNYWVKVHAATDLVRLVPETNTALILEGQALTLAQRRAIEELDATVEPYLKRPHQNTVRHSVSQSVVRVSPYNLSDISMNSERERER